MLFGGGLESVPNVGDEAYLYNNPSGYVELYVRVGFAAAYHSTTYSFVHFFVPGPSPPGLLDPIEPRVRALN